MMKKITLLSIAFAMLCFQANAQITEDFETDPPSGWTFMQTEGDDPGFIQTSARANSGTYSFYHNDDDIATESTSWMISPSYTVLAGDFLSFFYFNNYTDLGYGVESGVYISTTSADPITNPSDFTLLYDLLGNASEGAWALSSSDLTAYVGQTVYVAFKYVGDYEDELYIDDFAIEVPPAAPDCAATPSPTDGATDVPVGDLAFTWVAPATGPTPTSYNLYAGIESDYSDQGLVGNYTTTSADIEVSGYTTTFYWQVVPLNGTTEATGCSYWSFTTVDVPPAPANDLCSSPTTAPVGTGGTCGADITGTNISATDSGEPTTSCASGNYSGGDIWYEFTVPAGETEVIYTRSASDFSTTYIALYDSGTCGSLTELFCSSNASFNFTGLTAGNTYLLRLFDYGNNDFGDVTFCLSTPPPATAPPYINDFSVFPGAGWTEAGSGDIASGPSGTSGDWNATDFANDNAHVNGRGAKINLYSNVDQEWLLSTDFDLTGGSTYYLNLDVAVTDYNNSDPATMGSDDEVHVLITTDGGTSWTSLMSWIAGSEPGNAREASGEIDISSYAGNSNVNFAIWATDGSTDDSEDYDFHIDNFQVTTSSLSVEDNIIKGFSIYPNPVNDVLQLRALDNIDTISIYNLLGQEVVRTQPRVLQAQVDMSSLPTGMYVVKVQIGEQLGSYRIVKQ